MLKDHELTCLKDWLVSRSCPGCRRAQRDTNTLKTHAKISTSSRKQWWLEQRTTAMHTPRWSWEAIINYCTVQVIRGSWNLHIPRLHYLWAAGVKILLFSNLVPVFFLKRLPLFGYIHLIKSVWTWKRSWKTSVVADFIEYEFKQNSDLYLIVNLCYWKTRSVHFNPI